MICTLSIALNKEMLTFHYKYVVVFTRKFHIKISSGHNIDDVKLKITNFEFNVLLFSG